MKLISKGKKQKVKDAIKRRDSSIFTKNNEGPQRIISTSTVLEREDLEKQERLNRSLLRLTERGTLTGVKKTLEAGADINYQDDFGETPLMFAISEREEKIVRYLIDEGADLNLQNNDGGSPLSKALQYSQDDIFILLKNKGADLNVKDTNDRTLLFYAVGNGSVSSALMLLDQGGLDINAQDDLGNTSLHYAVANGEDKILKFLLHYDYGVTSMNHQIRNNLGETPLTVAKKTRNTYAEQLLQSYGPI